MKYKHPILQMNFWKIKLNVKTNEKILLGNVNSKINLKSNIKDVYFKY